jgi:hypothetical protein
MRYRVPLRAVFFLALAWIHVWLVPGCAQTSIAKAPANPQKKAAEVKLTPQQERGLRLLRSAQAEAAALQPDMRTFVLMQVADGYQKVDPSKVDALLKEAFTASLSMEYIAPQSDGAERFCPSMEGCGIKLWLQGDILSAIRSLPDVETLLSRAEPEVQRRVTESLIFRYITKKDFERARRLITSLDSQGNYPYEAAMHLIPAVTPSERVSIFARALNAYRQQGESTSYGSGLDGMPVMVMRFWQDVPTAMPVDAIDQILEKAKDVSPEHNVRLTFSGDAGTVALSSQYEYRLFQLLPLLRELDKPKAESLVRDNPDLQGLLSRFPEGLQAVQPDDELHPPKEGEPSISRVSVSSLDTPPIAINSFAVQAEQEIQRKERQIAAEADANPRQAIAYAMSLPEVPPEGAENSPRGSTLLRIAKKVGKKNPSVTKDALAELRKSLAQTSLMVQAKSIDDAAEEYLEIGDDDDADKTITETLRVAEKLYTKDADSGDPNRVFKGAWPSTNQRRRCVQITARFSPSRAEVIIADIRDPEIAAFEKIYFANALLGAPPRAMSVGEIHKNGEGMFRSF